MLCPRCKRREATGQYCKPCYESIILRRIKKNLRQIRPNDSVLILDSLSRHFLDTYLRFPINKIYQRAEGLGIKLYDQAVFSDNKIKKLVRKHSLTKVILPWTLDDSISLFLTNFFSNNYSKIKKNGKFLMLFFNITDEELALYLHRRKIRFKQYRNDIKDFIYRIKKRDPWSEYSFSRSIQALETINFK